MVVLVVPYTDNHTFNLCEHQMIRYIDGIVDFDSIKVGIWVVWCVVVGWWLVADLEHSG